MELVTLTLNPAFDIHCRLSRFDVGREHFVQERRCDVGGKGVNIARALHANGAPCTAYVLLGRENAAEFEKGLQCENISYRALYAEGRIRENLTLHPENAAETRISFEGFSSDASVLDSFEDMLPKTLSDTLVCFSGSVADGIGTAALKAFLLRLRAKGARLVLDSRSFTREDLLEIRPFLVKPNLDELKAYTDRPLRTEADIAACALALHRAGVECVMVTMGEKGALLASQGKCYRAYVPEISVRSTVGAGDSAVAGFLSAFLQDADAPACLRLASAFGCAACLSEGTKPPLASDVRRLAKRITVIPF